MWQLGDNHCICNEGSSASPGSLTGCKAMEEFFGLGMEGPEDDGGEGNLGRVEKNTKRAESNLAPPRLGATSTRESESVKGRVNVIVFRFSGRSYLSVSFCILTTAEEPLEFEMHLE